MTEVFVEQPLASPGSAKNFTVLSRQLMSIIISCRKGESLNCQRRLDDERLALFMYRFQFNRQS